MTAPDLRDQMAMAALTGLLASRRDSFAAHRFDPKDDAAYVYAIADAMLAQRARTPTKEDRHD